MQDKNNPQSFDIVLDGNRDVRMLRAAGNESRNTLRDLTRIDSDGNLSQIRWSYS